MRDRNQWFAVPVILLVGLVAGALLWPRSPSTPVPTTSTIQPKCWKSYDIDGKWLGHPPESRKCLAESAATLAARSQMIVLNLEDGCSFRAEDLKTGQPVPGSYHTGCCLPRECAVPMPLPAADQKHTTLTLGPPSTVLLEVGPVSLVAQPAPGNLGGGPPK